MHFLTLLLFWQNCCVFVKNFNNICVFLALLINNCVVLLSRFLKVSSLNECLLSNNNLYLCSYDDIHFTKERKELMLNEIYIPVDRKSTGLHLEITDASRAKWKRK